MAEPQAKRDFPEDYQALVELWDPDTEGPVDKDTKTALDVTLAHMLPWDPEAAQLYLKVDLMPTLKALSDAPGPLPE